MSWGRREKVGCGVALVAAGILVGGTIGLITLGRDTPEGGGTLSGYSILRAPDSGYPRFAMKSTIDPRYAAHLSGDPVAMLAPGVYAETPRGGSIGGFGDYHEYVGECAAVERYAREHPGHSTCF